MSLLQNRSLGSTLPPLLEKRGGIESAGPLPHLGNLPITPASCPREDWRDAGWRQAGKSSPAAQRELSDALIAEGSPPPRLELLHKDCAVGADPDNGPPAKVELQDRIALPQHPDGRAEFPWEQSQPNSECSGPCCQLAGWQPPPGQNPCTI